MIIFRRGSGLLALTALGGSDGAGSTPTNHTLAVNTAVTPPPLDAYSE